LETLLKDRTDEYYRFICDCLYPGHSLDLYIERDGDKILYVEINVTNLGGNPLWWRLKEAVKLILGKDATAHSVVIRPEDYNNLRCVLNEVGQNHSTYKDLVREYFPDCNRADHAWYTYEVLNLVPEEMIRIILQKLKDNGWESDSLAQSRHGSSRRNSG